MTCYCCLNNMKRTPQVEIKQGKNESSAAIIRRFSRRARELQLVRTVRGNRYYTRSKSKNMERQQTLSVLIRRKKYHELVKLGKIDPAANTHRRRR